MLKQQHYTPTKVKKKKNEILIKDPFNNRIQSFLSISNRLSVTLLSISILMTPFIWTIWHDPVLDSITPNQSPVYCSSWVQLIDALISWQFSPKAIKTFYVTAQSLHPKKDASCFSSKSFESTSFSVQESHRDAKINEAIMWFVSKQTWRVNLLSTTQGQLYICRILSDTVATGGQDDSGDCNVTTA